MQNINYYWCKYLQPLIPMVYYTNMTNLYSYPRSPLFSDAKLREHVSKFTLLIWKM